MTAPDRAALRAHLLASRIAGDVATPRESNMRNIAFAARRDPQYTFGLSWDERWDQAAILAAVVERVGIGDDPDVLVGPDRIDPERTLERLDAMARCLGRSAAAGETLLLATGHPSGLLPVHLAVAAAYAAAGGVIVTPGHGLTYESTGMGLRHRTRQVRYIGGVAMVASRGELNHTHSPRPMQLILEALATSGEARPDLVLADHGWAGAAGEAGIPTLGFADTNDPALFVGEATGRVDVVVPLDDNVLPHLYDPLAAYLVDGLVRRSA